MEGKCCLGDADMDPKLAGDSCAVGMDVGGEYGEEGDNEGEKWVSLDNVPSRKHGFYQAAMNMLKC